MSARNANQVKPPNSNLYETPGQFFNRLNDEFDFELDAFANADNRTCALFFSEERSAFEHDWTWSGLGQVDPNPYRPLHGFVNPPYASNVLGKAVTRACEMAQTFGGIQVALVPPSVDTQWWHNVVMRYASEVRFVRGRLSFEWRGSPIVGNKGSNCVVIFRPGIHGPTFTSMAATL